MTTTIAETLETATKKLGEVSDTPRLDAEVLLAMATGKNRTHFRAWPEKQLTALEDSTFQHLLEQRLAGHPIAHLTGIREFWSREFIVTPDVLIPRPETELLVELALRLMDGCGSKATQPPIPSIVELGRHTGRECRYPEHMEVNVDCPPWQLGSGNPCRNDGEILNSTTLPPMPHRNAVELTASPLENGGSFLYNEQTIRIADLGTGSGAIAITLALELPRAAITALDLSPAALSVAAENATRLGASNIRFIHSDWFAALPIRDHFDLIVSNAPYIAEHDPHLQQGDVRFEPSLALTSGPDGLDAIRRIVNEAPSRLNPGGWLLFEHGYNQADRVAELLRNAGFEEIESFPDLQGHVRVSGGLIR